MAAILNGLGGTKYEELFVLWNDVRGILAAAGLTVVQPLVGEFVTSLDMRGCSLTLVWLDEELEPLWTSPCASFVLHRGAISDSDVIERKAAGPEQAVSYPAARPASQEAGRCIAGIVEAIADKMKSEEEALGRLDAQASDGDHGQGMAR